MNSLSRIFTFLCLIAVAEQERRNGKYVYKSSRFAGGRAGGGGPQIKCDTLNGSIHVTAQ